MDDLLILLALAVWSGLWLLRELGRGGVTRRQASAALRRGRRRPRPVPDLDDRREARDRTPLDRAGLDRAGQQS